MLPAAAQLSIRSALDNMLTWTTLKLNKPAGGDKMSKKNMDIFSVVMTPDRIPKFFIPPLDVDHVFLPEADDVEGSTREKPITFEKRFISRSNRCRSESHLREESLCGRKIPSKKKPLCSTDISVLPYELESARDHADPATRAALSLPHLSKITTPYGFLALGESPNIRRKESLFFDHDPVDLRFLMSQKKKNKPLSRSPSTPLNDRKQQSCTQDMSLPKRAGRSASCEAICLISAHPVSSGSESCAIKSDKKRFQSLMKKHLSGIKRMRSNNGAMEKLQMPVGRTQSNPFA
ncbi:hypothetical protein NDU88_006361 [Pleurodeles waltl]|uniref:Uncharacterized protein n=1 Tax=Pleurodeles waltl TaxID=8319 RepID=A0AAV7WG29_PLEWA|nr:hypothetical protein NDU88_006361 [Pleurodeles waltl]